ncbi:hypothetical protein [Allochromatium palmeri]|uniref:Uncharacterized protein n=1 Tax=Allochromatium palmeri TaxID=231048 RepID=A0A6N8EFZ0_9GAMM|nr:hypothetical protein [Allochromatium palmeri]MTW23155.1 hypothetical protein [Allochromatium palmeri]
MLVIVLPLAILLVSALLVVGIGARRYWALDVLNGLYMLGLFYAIHLTVQVWRDADYSENWAMYGMLFFVWPYSLLVALLGGLEIALVWRNPHPRVQRARRLVAGIMAVLIGLSLSPLVAS